MADGAVSARPSYLEEYSATLSGADKNLLVDLQNYGKSAQSALSAVAQAIDAARASALARSMELSIVGVATGASAFVESAAASADSTAAARATAEAQQFQQQAAATQSTQDTISADQQAAMRAEVAAATAKSAAAQDAAAAAAAAAAARSDLQAAAALQDRAAALASLAGTCQALTAAFSSLSAAIGTYGTGAQRADASVHDIAQAILYADTGGGLLGAFRDLSFELSGATLHTTETALEQAEQTLIALAEAEAEAVFQAQERRLADSLASQVNSGQIPSDLVQQLQSYGSDPTFSAEFFSKLGPDGTITLVETLQKSGDQAAINALSMTLATASTSSAPGWDPQQFAKWMSEGNRAKGHEDALLALLKNPAANKSFDPQFLSTIADPLIWDLTHHWQDYVPVFGGGQGPHIDDDGRIDIVLQALSENPNASAKFLGGTWSESSDSRMSTLLQLDLAQCGPNTHSQFDQTLSAVIDQAVVHASEPDATAAALAYYQDLPTQVTLKLTVFTVRQFGRNADVPDDQYQVYPDNKMLSDSMESTLNDILRTRAAQDITGGIYYDQNNSVHFGQPLIGESDRSAFLSLVSQSTDSASALTKGVTSWQFKELGLAPPDALQSVAQHLGTASGEILGQEASASAGTAETLKSLFESTFGIGVAFAVPESWGLSGNVGAAEASPLGMAGLEKLLGIQGGLDTMKEAMTNEATMKKAAAISLFEQMMVQQSALFNDPQKITTDQVTACFSLDSTNSLSINLPPSWFKDGADGKTIEAIRGALYAYSSGYADSFISGASSS